jgi:hypothetical protein
MEHIWCVSHQVRQLQRNSSRGHHNSDEAIMKPRDAIISFQCLPPDLLQIVETIDGADIRHAQVKWDPNIVTGVGEEIHVLRGTG